MQVAPITSYHTSQTNHTATSLIEGREAPLGNNTKFASLLPADNVIVRYFLQAEARRLLPGSRVSICHRVMVPTKATVDVMYSPLVGNAHYKNLMHCDSVWLCAVCASKITERRRMELTAALAVTTFTPIMVTYTLRHHSGDSLKSLIEAVLKSFHNLKSGAGWQGIREQFGVIGSIRSLEVTHGENGWHPHIHDLILLEKPLNPVLWGKLITKLKTRWGKILKRAKRDASWEHGVDVRETREYIDEYIAKFGHQPVNTGWTIEQELTKAPVKRAKGENGRTPQQLLADSANGDQIASMLFLEYARCFKGKKQLVWSKGLRELLGLDALELTDAEINEIDSSPAFVLAQLSKAQWDIILGNDARGELLKIASAGDWQALAVWLRDFDIVLDF